LSGFSLLNYLSGGTTRAKTVGKTKPWAKKGGLFGEAEKAPKEIDRHLIGKYTSKRDKEKKRRA